MREPRLGDDIDDYCVRCKRIMNHSVVSVIDAAPAKVRCRICHSDHDFRHEQAPPPKVDARKQALFNEVLKKANPLAVVAADVAVEELEEVLAIPMHEEAETVAAKVVGPPKPRTKAVARRAAAAPKAKSKPAARVKAKARK